MVRGKPPPLSVAQQFVWLLGVGIQTAKLKKIGVKAPAGRFFLRISEARLAGKIEQGEAVGRGAHRDK